MQPIHSAVTNGHTDVINILVEKYGVDPQEADVRIYNNVCRKLMYVLRIVISQILPVSISVYINKIICR